MRKVAENVAKSCGKLRKQLRKSCGKVAERMQTIKESCGNVPKRAPQKRKCGTDQRLKVSGLGYLLLYMYIVVYQSCEKGLVCPVVSDHHCPLSMLAYDTLTGQSFNATCISAAGG